MKFFTMDWWLGSTDADPIALYAAHLAAVSHLVPPQLLALGQNQPYTLHDARLRELRIDVAHRELMLNFDVDDRHGGFKQKLRLVYQNVLSVETVADPVKGFSGPHGYGELGYDEIDVTSGGFEHQLLFSSGIELRVQFTGFSLTAGRQ